MTVIEKIVCYSQPPRGEGKPHHAGLLGKRKRQGWSWGRESKGKCGQEPLLWFLWEGMGEAGWAGLASLHRFSGLGTGEVFSCVVPGPGMPGQVDSGPERENMVKEMAGVWALDWFAYGKCVPSKSFAVPGNLLALGGAVSPDSAGLSRVSQSIRKTENNKA